MIIQTTENYKEKGLENVSRWEVTEHLVSIVLL